MLLLDERSQSLGNAETGERFEADTRRWLRAPAPLAGERISLLEAAAWLQHRSGWRLRQPVGVIGPREASAEQMAAAEDLGRGLARTGFAVVCGGRQGVMEAVCHGVAKGGGISVGLLPEAEAAYANNYVTVAIATGIGEARNAIIARAAFCLVAIGNSYGTLSEVALGLQFGRPVFGLVGAAEVPGVRALPDVEAALDAVARVALALPTIEPQ
jgi:uncharacterized protein (TIGR00725 family)